MKFSSVMTPAFMVIRFLLVLALCIGNYSCSENSSKDFYIQAEKATNDGDIAKAISLYKSAIEADDSFIEAYQKLGTIYYLQNSYEEAFNNLLANNKLSDKCRIMVADCYIKMSISMSKGEKLEIVDKTADEVSC